MGDPEGEDELRSGHDKLRDQALKEAGWTFLPDHLGDNPNAALWVVEVAVLNAGLDDIEGCRDEERGRGTTDR